MTVRSSNSVISTASTILTAFVAVVPGEVLGYLAKLVSVFVLAVVAELGRRLIAKLWREK